MEEDVTATCNAGIPGLELKSWKLDDYLASHALSELKAILADSGLKFPSLGPYTMISSGSSQEKSTVLDKMKQHAEIAAEIGVPGLIASFDEPRTPSEKTDNRDLGHFIEIADPYAEALDASGLKLGLESLGGQEIFRGPREALKIIHGSRMSNIRVVYDTFHFYRNGVSVEELSELPQESIFIVHVSDCKDLPLKDLVDTDRVYPGQGVMPLTDLIKPAIEKGYQGFISVEVPRPENLEQPVSEICPVAMSHLQKLVDRL